MLKFAKAISLALGTLAITCGLALAQKDARFVGLGAYFELHPLEKAKFEAFDRMVQAPAQALERPIDKPVEIHVIYPGLQVSDYWRRSVKSFVARLDEVGIPHRITSLFTKSAEDLRLQEKAIGQVLREKPDYLIFTLDALRHKGMIARVLAAGDTKVILQNITTPLTEIGPPSPLLYVGFDHEIGSHILAEEFIRRARNGARYAIFYGPPGYVSQMRGGTFRHVMEEQTDFELVAEYYVGFDRELARQAALDLFKAKDDVSFIYAASTDIAHGITDALSEIGKLGDVTVNGWGGGSSELDAIRKRELDFTVMRMNDDNGVAMAEAIRLIQEGRVGDVPLVYSGSFTLVDQKTSDETLESLVDRAFRYSR
ncbi:substrate-binding domain-containing protein [Nisaea acidiphila]|uniref:Substrate-binding domain-containing protein n=1 Tax=Nisaea acidiphila TaxID=1862145 RepID=A0A9J7AZ69_9PROT|nr:substrate-binding domain-containing protein [Nisaea acidiphila]UUX51556.1 substrate-binding domain-containing protein [Nisaea acidiphila]